MKTFYERFPEVPSTEVVLLELYCSITENGSKARGWLYITPRRVAFQSLMGNHKKNLLLETIKEVSKKNLGSFTTGIDLLLTDGSIIYLREIIKASAAYEEIIKVKTDIKSSSWWRLFG